MNTAANGAVIAAPAQSLSISAADMRAQVNLIQEVMEAVMIGPGKEAAAKGAPEGVHYGIIPGTPKPTLFKAGAEKLAQTFRIAASYEVGDISTDDCVRYRITCTGTHQLTRNVLGSGLGECSSFEEKYKWRKANKREFEATTENRRRVKFGYSRGNGEFEIQQIRTESADQANTVLKMACKRALVAMILTVTAASDIFTQDVEDLPEHLREHDDGNGGGATTLPEYDADRFEKNLPTWIKTITSGKRTVEEAITWIESRATLTDAQKKRIRDGAAKPAKEEVNENA